MNASSLPLDPPGGDIPTVRPVPSPGGMPAGLTADHATRWLAAIVESSDDAIISKNLSGIVTSWNRAAERLFGYAAAEAVGQSILLIIPPDRHDEERTILARLRAGDRIAHYETVRRRKDGTLIDVALTISPIVADDGRILGASKIARDITERRRAQEELRRREQIHRAIGESINYGTWVTDAEGRCLQVSDSFLQLTGLTLAECQGQGWMEKLHPDERAATRAAWEECVHRGCRWERELLFLGADGAWHPILTRGVPIRDAAGRVTSWVGLNLDIANLKRTEEALRARERQLQLITEHAPVFIILCDREHRLTYANQAYAERYGLTLEQVIGARVADVVGEAAYATFRPHLDAAFAGQRVEFEMEIPYERLGPRWVHVIYVPDRSDSGEVVGIVAVINDITARKLAEREIELSRDRALAASRAKDLFLATLSHELRTPLNPALLIASESAEDPRLPPAVRHAFATIRDNVELEARLIDDLLDLTRISRSKLPLEMQEHDAHAILQDAIGTIRPDLLGKRIQLILDLGAHRPALWGDAVRLRQIFWNVLKNAAKFTPPQGRIIVETQTPPGTGRFIVRVTDSGIGMTSEELGRVFDAFTQGEHAGTRGSHLFGGVGLGLAISRSLVELHSGRIHASSEGRGRGSTFTIELPLAGSGLHETEPTPAATAPASPGPAPRADAAPPGGDREPASARWRILLVEDHEPTRLTLAHLLDRRHFDVMVAAGVTEARALAARDKFDLLISDLGLPDGSGCDLMTELRTTHGLQGIALSGYGMDQDVVRSREAGFAIHLTKPVRIQSLDEALARLSLQPPAGAG